MGVSRLMECVFQILLNKRFDYQRIKRIMRPLFQKHIGDIMTGHFLKHDGRFGLI